MLKRQSKTEAKATPTGPPKVLIVDDDAGSSRLLAKLCVRAGYEVAEVSDQQLALMALMNVPEPIAAVVCSFTESGNAASLRLLDAVRRTPDARVNRQRMVLVLDAPRQMKFSWKSGADDVLLRPYSAGDLIGSLRDVIGRDDAARLAYRARRLDELEAAPETHHVYETAGAGLGH